MDKPWEITNNFFDQIGFCRRSTFSSIIRHNYIPIRLTPPMMKIVCKHCGHKIINNNVSGLQKKVRKDLILMDKNKNMGDITIYLIYWRKDKMGSWLDFPGLFYIGQTKKTVEERVYGISSSHFFRAFKNPKCAIEYTIKKYSKNLEAAKKLFKAEPIQIVRYQGTKLLTRKLANMVEKFWIGYFHTQFNEFGRNIEPGGSKVYESIIIPFNFLDNALHEAGFLPRSGNIERKHYVYDKLGLKRTQNRIIDNSIKYWYGFKSKMFVKALRLKRIQIIKDLFERGYKLAYISTELNADRHDIKKWIENDLYKEKKILLPYKVLRNNILIKKIIEYMSKGSTTPESLLKLLPGLQTTEAIKHIIRKNLGGWNNAIRTYAPKTDFWAIAKDLLEKRKALVTSGKASDYTVVEFAHALGSATRHSTSALKYIRRKLNTSITWEEIKKLILDC